MTPELHQKISIEIKEIAEKYKLIEFVFLAVDVDEKTNPPVNIVFTHKIGWVLSDIAGQVSRYFSSKAEKVFKQNYYKKNDNESN